MIEFKYRRSSAKLKHDPEKWVPVFRKRSCSKHNLERDGDSKKSRLALALLWQILSSTGFPNRFFCDSWVVGFWRGRPWLAGHRIGKTSLAIGSGRFWIGWATRRGDKCVRSTCRD